MYFTSVVVIFSLISYADGGFCFKERCTAGGREGCKVVVQQKFNSANQCCKLGSAPFGYYERIQMISVDCMECYPCHEILVKVDGGWSDWDEWSDCNEPCGGGSRSRTRRCDNPIPSMLGKNCEGPETDTEECNTHTCPIHGGWSDWSKWSPCSKTCGRGTKTRSRACNNPPADFGGNPCKGPTKENQGCTLIANCPIHGGWSAWGDWSRCSKTCGSGVSLQRRSCTKPRPQYNGRQCIGEDENYKTCNDVPCPVHGGWSPWSQWSKCLAYDCKDQAKGGYRVQTRSCNNPRPSLNGRSCSGPFFERRYCVDVENCEVDGKWGPWTNWDCSNCFAAIRYRKCDNPPPAFGGKKCKETEGVDVLQNRRKIFEKCPECKPKATTAYPEGYSDDEGFPGDGNPSGDGSGVVPTEDSYDGYADAVTDGSYGY